VVVLPSGRQLTGTYGRIRELEKVTGSGRTKGGGGGLGPIGISNAMSDERHNNGVNLTVRSAGYAERSACETLEAET